MNKMNENENNFYVTYNFIIVSMCINVVEFRVLLTSTVMIGL